MIEAVQQKTLEHKRGSGVEPNDGSYCPHHSLNLKGEIMSKNPVTDGTHEDHVRAGQQSHKNSAATDSKFDPASKAPAGNQGGTHEQHVQAGQQSHKNASDTASSSDGAESKSGGQGGTHEQHVNAGKQSHKTA